MKKVKILFVGDIVGDPGMGAIRLFLKNFIKKYEADIVILNGENICNGKGLTDKESRELFELGADAITTGNHIWENWQSKPLLANNPMVIRPYNYPPGNAGRGYTFINKTGIPTIGVLQLQGRTYMQSIDCPFRGADYALSKIKDQAHIVIVDFHADATAEKVSMGWHLDGRVSAVLGTHTHIQTADACILPKGTAYITDVGMTGPYDSVLGMNKEVALKRLILQTAHKYEMAENDAKISGVVLEIDAETGKSLSISPFMFPEMRRTINE
jgi:2',3'-cyclic-nucleotide 2'-phosphodiesterase